MLKTNSFVVVVAGSLAAAGLGSPASAADLRGTGFLAGGQASFARGVSRDGRFVIGESHDPIAGAQVAAKWSQCLATLTLQQTFTGPEASGRAADGDGITTVGAAFGTSPYGVVWDAAESPFVLGGDPDSLGTVANSIGDTSIVGAVQTVRGLRPCEWDRDGNLRFLATIPSLDTTGEALGVSVSGDVVVGYLWSTTGFVPHAVVWTRTGGAALLGQGVARAVSLDGSTVVGSLGQSAFRRTSAGVDLLGTLTGDRSSEALAVSGDGSVVVGLSHGPNGSHAFYWSASTGMIDLADLLRVLGANTTNWSLMRATGISADGLTIVGSGVNDLGNPEGWIATLATSTAGCPSDLDDGTQSGRPDGAVTIDDLMYFLPRYEMGVVDADVDDGSGAGGRDCAVDLSDLLYFMQRFEAGC